MSLFLGKVALITGASSGIGEALAQEFVREGGQVVLLARRLDRLSELAKSLNASGEKALAIECDVTRDGDLEKAAAQAIKKFGKIDVVVANAGFGVSGNLDDLNLDDYRRQFETNVLGLLRTIYATKEELKRTKGRLALVSSVSGYVSVPGISPYSMSKYAVRALAEALVTELDPLGISTTLISPGFITTEIRKVDNKGQYHEGSKDTIPDWLCMPAPKAARIMVKAIAKRQIEVIVTGHGKFIVGLSHRMPKTLIRLMRRFKVSGRPQPKSAKSEIRGKNA